MLLIIVRIKKTKIKFNIHTVISTVNEESIIAWLQQMCASGAHNWIQLYTPSVLINAAAGGY